MPGLNRLGEFLTPRSVVEDSVKAVYGDPGRVTDVLVDRYFEMLMREGNRRALNLRLQQLAGDLAPERIRTLHLPTLILWGERDHLVPPADAQRFHQDIAGSRLVMLPGLGHVSQEEDAQASVAPVRVFLGLDTASDPAPATPAPSQPDARSAERTR